MSLAALITVLAQIGMGAGAWRLANALRGRVDDHEIRIGRLENAQVGTLGYILAGVGALGSLVAGAVYFIHRYLTLESQSADLALEGDRVTAMDAAAAAQRAARQKAFDAQAAAVSDAAGAAKLLHDELSKP